MHQQTFALLQAALRAFAAGDIPGASQKAQAASAADPTASVAREAARYLIAAHARQGVYVTGEAFAAFIRGGGNLGLYEAVSAALRAAYDAHESPALLDIGVGDGMALLPALTPGIRSIQLVEPSAPMLARTLEALAASGAPAEAFGGTLQAFLDQAPADARWDIAQATFSLQSIPRRERVDALRRLRPHVSRLLIAEFDVPPLCDDPLDEACARHILERYELGLAEYAGDGGLVAQGFLMPVMFGIFDPTAARTNYEQPAARWADDLRAAGFGAVQSRALFDYWWAPAVLLDAR